MQPPKILKGIRRMMEGKNEDLEVSEELTNAYFGNEKAWQIDSQAKSEDAETNPNELQS